jgi:ankyrin repeat protein
MTVAAIRKALNDLRPHQVNPDGRRILPESDKQELLAHAYEQTMERIANHTQRRRELAMQALSWITFADGLLRKSELQHALAVESGKTALDQENVPRIEDIVSSCAGLVTVDEQSDIVRLVHYTAQEYLESTHCRWFPDAELAIVRTCISYLSLDVFGDISLAPKTLEELHVSYPLYSYASENWGYHARRLQGVCQEVVAFLQDESKVAGACHGQLGRFDLFIPPFTGLHLASYFGLHETMEILLETVLDADAEDYQSQTPLFYAVMENHESAVRALLGSGRVNAAHRDRWGQTVLSHLDGSDGAMLNLLVEVGGLDPDLKDDFGRTTMSRAATAGNDGLVRLLLDCHGADVNSRDINNRTPISYAAGAGSDNIVKMLLASGRAEADQIDREGRTPLSHAAEMGHKSVVDLLLACGQVEADRKDSLGRTPLSYAAMCGHAAIVALLMSRNDTDINSADKMRRTPLFYATASGDDRGEIVALLLARQDVDPNLHDLVGSTPLSVAARLGHTEMVKLLLGHPGVKPDCEDSFGRTALAWATREGKGEVVKLLASRLGESEGDVCTEEEEAADPIPDVEIGLHDSGLQRCFMCLRKIVGSQYWCERCVEWQPSPLCKECLGSGFGCPVGDGGHEQLLVFVPEL